MKKNISILLIVMGLALQVYVSGVNAKIAGFYSKVGIPPTGLSTDEIRQAKDIEDTSVKLLNGKIITNDERGLF